MKASPEAQQRLLELADLDTELARLDHRRRTLPEAGELEQLAARAAKARDAAVVAETELSDLSREQTRAERDVEQVRLRIDRDQSRLDGGSVSSAKELESLQSEVVSLKRRQGDLEEVVLELMEKLEAVTSRRDEAAAVRDSIAAETAEVTGRRDAALAEITEAAGKASSTRASVVAGVPADLLALYDKVRAQAGGIGAAMLRRGRCEGCRESLPMAELSEIRAAAPDEVIRHEECRRILVRTSESGVLPQYARFLRIRLLSPGGTTPGHARYEKERIGHAIDSLAVDDRGKLSSPGGLSEGTVVADKPRVPDQPLAALAAHHGLRLSGARPSLSAYLAMLWQRRHFIIGYATARNVSMYTDARLGQLWQVLTPLLNAGVYYMIFGLLFQAARGVQNYPAFLVAGVFVFAFTERSIVVGSNVMRANLQLIRALYFPRASLPLAYVLVELQQMLVGMVVLIAVMLASGEWPTWYWFLVVPAVALQTLFNTGAALIVSRMGGSIADVSELIPFFLRVSRYFCGVMYMITTLPAAVPQWALKVLSLNPPAVYISLVRVALMKSYRTNSPGNAPYSAANCAQFHADPRHNIPLQAACHAIVTNTDLWVAAVGWGIGIFLIGIVFFWQAESKYGRG